MRKVPALPLAMAAAALTALAVLFWIAVIAWHAVLGGGSSWDGVEIWLLALTIPAAAVGAALTWRSQRWSPFLAGMAVTALPMAAVPLLSSESSPKDQVSAALSDLGYDYRFLPEREANGYVVFRAHDVASRADVVVAFAGLRENGRCDRPPTLPRKHRPNPKPFAAAGPEPIICFESDTHRLPKGPRAISRHRMTAAIANGLCEEAVGGWAFECFD